MKPKDIFGLAVRLLGLYFLYLGLNAVAQMLNADIFESPDKSDLVNGLWPVIFDLVVAIWLMSGWLFGRLAYPESRKTVENLPVAARPASLPQAVPAAELKEMDAEKKLAALVEPPKKFA